MLNFLCLSLLRYPGKGENFADLSLELFLAYKQSPKWFLKFSNLGERY